MFPIVTVENQGSFAAKIAGVIVGSNLVGAAVFLIARRRRAGPVSRPTHTRPSFTDAQLQDLAARFASAAIPKAEWTHAAHLAVGLWHVDRYGPEEALTRLRGGIRRLNDSHGTPNSTTGGYHETVTRAYVVLFTELLAAGAPGTLLAERLLAVLTGPLGARDALLEYYSREKLFSPHAREVWEEPDLHPLNARERP